MREKTSIFENKYRLIETEIANYQKLDNAYSQRAAESDDLARNLINKNRVKNFEKLYGIERSILGLHAQYVDAKLAIKNTLTFSIVFKIIELQLYMGSLTVQLERSEESQQYDVTHQQFHYFNKALILFSNTMDQIKPADISIDERLKSQLFHALIITLKYLEYKPVYLKEQSIFDACLHFNEISSPSYRQMVTYHCMARLITKTINSVNKDNRNYILCSKKMLDGYYKKILEVYGKKQDSRLSQLELIYAKIRHSLATDTLIYGIKITDINKYSNEKKKEFLKDLFEKTHANTEKVIEPIFHELITIAGDDVNEYKDVELQIIDEIMQCIFMCLYENYNNLEQFISLCSGLDKENDYTYILALSPGVDSANNAHLKYHGALKKLPIYHRKSEFYEEISEHLSEQITKFHNLLEDAKIQIRNKQSQHQKFFKHIEKTEQQVLVLKRPLTDKEVVSYDVPPDSDDDEILEMEPQVLEVEDPLTAQLRIAACLYQNKKIDEASSKYRELMNTSQNTHISLLATDGLIHCLGYSFLRQLGQMRSTLSGRLRSGKPLQKQEQTELSRLIIDSREKLNSLNGLYHLFLKKSQQVDETINQQLEACRYFVYGLFHNILEQAEKVSVSYKTLQDFNLMMRRENFIKLGLEVVKRDKLDRQSEDELFRLGRDESVRRHIEKQNAGLSKSGYVEEREILALFPDYLQNLTTIVEDLNKRASTYIPKANPVDIPSATSAKIMKVELPENVKLAFSFLHSVSEEHYLVGSTLMSLCTKNGSNIKPEDMDFITASASDGTLKSQGLRQTVNMSNLYYYADDDHTKIELLCLKSENNWALKSAMSRDFTASALFCNKLGITIDPTGLGFEDLNNRLIRTIGDPAVRVQNDAAILLRAVKYKVNWQFNYDPALKKAIMEWGPDHATNFNHLSAIVAGQLKRKNSKQYVEELIETGLLVKMFNIKFQGNIYHTIDLLKEKLDSNYRKIVSGRSQTHFKQADDVTKVSPLHANEDLQRRKSF